MVEYRINTRMPLEQTFFIEDAVKDPKYKNRYHFKFPAIWKTCLNREPLIGIRKIYIPRAFRHIEYDFKIEKYNIKGDVCEADPFAVLNFHVITYLNESRHFSYLKYSFDDNYAKARKEQGEIDSTILTNFKEKDEVIWDFSYEINSINGEMSLVEIIKSSNTDKLVQVRFAMYNLNDEALAVFNYKSTEIVDPDNPPDPEDPPDLSKTKIPPIKYYDVWDRTNNMISASFCNLTKRNYLGFSEELFSPIKYYKLNENTDSFWIEVWNSRNRKCPNVLPLDMKEGLIIEAVLVESGNDRIF